jgi:nicotinamide mononucleotide transporter
MAEFLSILWEQIKETGNLEWIAVVTSLSYVYLAARESIWCWLFAFISSGLYVFLTFHAQLFLESSLQFFYVIMAIYGFFKWNSTPLQSKRIIKWPLINHLTNITLSALVTAILGYLFATYTSQAAPYLDAFTTVFSLVATFMVAHRVLENWMYWIVIDAALVFLYFGRGLKLTALLMAVYCIFAIFGFFHWKKRFEQQST